MSQRESGYERKERDLYETPAWVTEALHPHLYGGIFHVWEPACGSGKMVRALESFGLTVNGTDIENGADFLLRDCGFDDGYEAIITNPPYALAQEFIEHALSQPVSVVAMLLRTDYDHAKSRQHLFQDQRFAKKVVLTKRIKWFEDSKGQPSFNHAWFIWETAHSGPPTLAYGPVYTPPAKETVWLRGGPDRDYPCNNPNMVECAASECQDLGHCRAPRSPQDSETL